MASGSSLLTETSPPLLASDEPLTYAIHNPGGRATFLLLGDHAGNRIPAALGDLDIAADDRVRHIAWDIGVGALGERLATRLDAVFVRGVYSRLVVDCNRAPGAADAMPAISDGTRIPGNAALSAADRAARIAAIHTPYHDAVAAELARRAAAGLPTIIVSLHSFTPVMAGYARPWQIGVLHDRGDARFAHALLRELGRDTALTVGDNEPYRMDEIDYTIPRHAFPAGHGYAEIEIRQDLLANEAQIDGWAALLDRALNAALVAVAPADQSSVSATTSKS